MFITIPLVFYVKKDFYLLDALNDKIELLKAAGLINFWQSQDIHIEILKDKSPNFARVLKFTQLVGCFQLLLFGLLISFIVFLLEIAI